MNGMQGDRHRWDAELRSLNRRRLYQIFPPLDAKERLPRELLLEQQRYALLSWRRVAVFLWPLVFLAGLGLAAWIIGQVR